MKLECPQTTDAVRVRRSYLVRCYGYFAMASCLLVGCTFFGNEYDECFNVSDCPPEGNIPGEGGADGQGDANGQGGAGSDMSWDNSGGQHGSGGSHSGGSGGSNSGGSNSGGSNSGGSNSGGSHSGGSGGSNSGGAGTGGSGGSDPITLIMINELRDGASTYVEIYNSGTKAVSLQYLWMTDGVDQPNWDSNCSLAEVPSLSAKGFLEITSAATCRGQGPCVTNCSWSIKRGETAYLLDDSSGHMVKVQMLLFPLDIMLAVGQSYAAYPDGSMKFDPRMQSPGAPN